LAAPLCVFSLGISPQNQQLVFITQHSVERIVARFGNNLNWAEC
jgi:hypothetical protein